MGVREGGGMTTKQIAHRKIIVSTELTREAIAEARGEFWSGADETMLDKAEKSLRKATDYLARMERI